MRAAIYLRISQDRSGEGLGVSRQRDDGLDLLRRRSWELHREYADNDVSAAGRKQRPEFAELLDDIRSGKVDVVIAWSLDRLFRTLRDRVALVEACKEHNVSISLVRGNDIDLTTPAGRLYMGLLGEIAQHEIDAKSDRQVRAHAQAAGQGRRVGGRRPFGYEQDGMTLRPVEAEHVRRAYADYLAGTPLLAVAKRWNKAGLLSGVVSPKTGEPTSWDHSGVRWVLRNARYAGLRVHNGEVVGKAQWPAIVTETTYRRTIALLDSSASDFKPRGGRRLLTGVARCGVCDEPIHVGGNKKGTPPVYRCPTGKHVTRRAEPVEAVVSEFAFRVLSTPEWAKQVVAAQLQEGEELLQAEADRIRGEMDSIAVERAAHIITPRQFSLMNTGYQAQLADIESRMSTTTRDNVVAALVADGMTRKKWDALAEDGPDKQRFVIGAILDIRLHSGGRGVRNPPPETIQMALKTTSA